MSRSYLFALWAGGGNVNPYLGLAELLHARGDRVTAVATPSLRGRLESAGIEVADGSGWLPNEVDLLAAAERFGPDALVVDYMLTSALCGAEVAGAPTAALVHTLYRAILADGAPSPIGMASSLDSVNDVRRSLGLGAVGSFGGLLTAVDKVLVAAPRELDEPGEVPSNVDYVGALFEGPGPDAGWEPPPGDGPLVVVCVGTAGDPDAEAGLLTRVSGALGRLPVRGFVTAADHLDRATLDAPPNVSIAGYVRHAAVLPHADLLVTHAGLGSVVAALASGVPMVCVPLDREQPDNARAVARIGAGVALDPAATVDELRDAVAEQLGRADRVRLEPDPARALAALDSLHDRGRAS